jgi:hypothetical protein
LDSAARGLGTTIAEVGVACQTVADATRDFATTTASLPQGMYSSVSQAMVEMESRVAALVGELKFATTALQQSLADIDVSLGHNQSAAQGQVSELSQSREELQRISHSLALLAAPGGRT